MDKSPVDQLAAASRCCEQIIADIRADQWGAPTPCSAWTVRDLVGHLITGNQIFVDVLRGAVPPARGGGSPAGAVAAEELAAAYGASVESLLNAFSMPGVLEKEVFVPIGTVPRIAALHLRMVETLVHGWDLAQATGQHAEYPNDLVEQELAFTQEKLSDLPPGRSPFAPPQTVAPDAAPIDRLAGLLGRAVQSPAPR